MKKTLLNIIWGVLFLVPVSAAILNDARINKMKQQVEITQITPMAHQWNGKTVNSYSVVYKDSRGVLSAPTPVKLGIEPQIGTANIILQDNKVTLLEPVEE